MEYTGCASASAGRSSFTKESHETGLRHLRRRTGGRPSGYALLHLDGIGQRGGLLRHRRLFPVPGPCHRRPLHVVDRHGRLWCAGLPRAAGGCPGGALPGGADPAGRYFSAAAHGADLSLRQLSGSGLFFCPDLLALRSCAAPGRQASPGTFAPAWCLAGAVRGQCRPGGAFAGRSLEHQRGPRPGHGPHVLLAVLLGLPRRHRHPVGQRGRGLLPGGGERCRRGPRGAHAAPAGRRQDTQGSRGCLPERG